MWRMCLQAKPWGKRMKYNEKMQWKLRNKALAVGHALPGLVVPQIGLVQSFQIVADSKNSTHAQLF